MNVSRFGRFRFRRHWCGGPLVRRSLLLTLLATIVSPVEGVTLKELFDGSVLNVANSQFSDWELLALDSTAPSLPDFSQITVVPLAGDPSLPNIRFVANGQLAISGINSIDLSIKFRVDALSGSDSFNGHSLAITDIAFGAAGGIAYVSSEVVDRTGADLGPAVVIVDSESGVLQPSTDTSFAPHTQTFVVMNIFVTGLSATDSINLATLTQGFIQIGPPGIPGDYSENGVVDASDYTVWRDNLASPTALPNDDTLGVDAGDYARWKMHFGESTLGGAVHTAVVPEPTSVVLWSAALGLTSFARSRRRTSTQADSRLSFRA